MSCCIVHGKSHFALVMSLCDCVRLVNKSFQVIRILPSYSEVLNCKN